MSYLDGHMNQIDHEAGGVDTGFKPLDLISKFEVEASLFFMMKAKGLLCLFVAVGATLILEGV